MWEEDDVDKDQADRDAILAEKLGIRFKPEYIARVYNIPIAEFEISTTPVITNAPAAGLPQQVVSQFSAAPAEVLDRSDKSDKSDRSDSPAEAITAAFTDAELQDQVEPMIKPILDLVANSSSFNEVMEGIINLFPQMDTTKLQDALDRAGFAANIYGRMTADKK